MTTLLNRLGTRSKLMGRMMERCGVDPAELARDRFGAGLAAAARACMACGSTDSCRRWLEAADPEAVNTPPAFCPNARRFGAVRTVN